MSSELLLSPVANSNPLKADKPDNPRRGIIFYLLSGACVCVNLLSSKILYERNAELNGGILLVFRGALSSVLLGAFHNSNLKYVMYDSIEPSCAKPLAVRVVSGNFAIFAVFMATKYFSLTASVMVLNCAPLVSFCLAGPVLGEKVTVQQIAFLILAFGGLSLMILGGTDKETRPQYIPTLAVYIVFFFQPFALSAGTLAMRAARKLNEDVVACYMAFSLFIVFYPICVMSGQKLEIWHDFGLIDFGLLLQISIGTITSQTLRFKAL